jgi:hypothetical protein
MAQHEGEFMTYRSVSAALGLAAALAIATGAHAQGAYPQPPQGPYNHPQDQGPQGREGEQQGPDIQGLHDALRLTPAQDRDWQAYLAAISPDPGAEARHRAASMMMATLPTPRRIDLLAAQMEEDLSAMRRQGEAVKAFYARLAPDQQRIFDARTLPPAEPQGDQR